MRHVTADVPGGHTRALVRHLRMYGADGVVLQDYRYHLAKPHSTAVTICTTGSEAEGTRHVTPHTVCVPCDSNHEQR